MLSPSTPPPAAEVGRPWCLQLLVLRVLHWGCPCPSHFGRVLPLQTLAPAQPRPVPPALDQGTAGLQLLNPAALGTNPSPSTPLPAPSPVPSPAAAPAVYAVAPAAEGPVFPPRPPRPPGVGPSISPAPVTFLPLEGGIPTLKSQAPSVGPASAAAVTAAAGGAAAPGTCQTLLQILQGIPEVSDWLQLLKARRCVGAVCPRPLLLLRCGRGAPCP